MILIFFPTYRLHITINSLNYITHGKINLVAKQTIISVSDI